jgi:hypothetical protein
MLGSGGGERPLTKHAGQRHRQRAHGQGEAVQRLAGGGVGGRGELRGGAVQVDQGREGCLRSVGLLCEGGALEAVRRVVASPGRAGWDRERRL